MVTLVLGQTTIRVPQMAPYHVFNVRYGLEAMPFLALGAGSLAAFLPGRLQDPAPMLAAALHVITMAIGTPITLAEGMHGDAVANVPQETAAAAFLKANYQGGRILADDSLDSPMLFHTGLRLSQFVTVGFHPYYERALAAPAGNVRWVVVFAGDAIDAADAQPPGPLRAVRSRVPGRAAHCVLAGGGIPRRRHLALMGLCPGHTPDVHTPWCKWSSLRYSQGTREPSGTAARPVRPPRRQSSVSACLTPESIPNRMHDAGGLHPTGVRGLTVRLISPDLALDRLHLIVPDGSDAMVVLTTLADGDAKEADPRDLFAQRISEVGHLTVSFGDDEPPQLRVALPDLTLECVPQESPDHDPDHLALRVLSMRPAMDHPDGSKVLTVTARTPIVTAANGVASDTRRLLDWRAASAAAAKSAELYAALKLVDSLEKAERGRAATQRTHFVAAKEYWRCKRCRALWRPADHERCPSCGHEFTDADRRQPEVGKVEFTVPEGEQINLTPDAAVLVEPEDEPNFVGRVSRIDHHRHTVEVTCRTFEHAGSEGTITPSFNKALYQAKRSVLAAIATRDFGVGSARPADGVTTVGHRARVPRGRARARVVDRGDARQSTPGPRGGVAGFARRR